MGKITRKAADEIRRTVQVVKGLPPGGASFRDPGFQIFLGKTEQSIAVDDSGSVRIYVGDKGSEGASDQVVTAYSRIDSYESGEWCFIRWIGEGWEIISGRRPATAGAGDGCGACTDTAGTLTVEVDTGIYAATLYRFSPMCGGLLPIVFEASGTPPWAPTTSLSASCDDEGTVTATASLDATGVGIGEVTVSITADGNTWTWTNDTFWQTDMAVSMRRVTGPVDCPCSTWVPYPCLLPLDA